MLNYIHQIVYTQIPSRLKTRIVEDFFLSEPEIPSVVHESREQTSSRSGSNQPRIRRIPSSSPASIRTRRRFISTSPRVEVVYPSELFGPFVAHQHARGFVSSCSRRVTRSREGGETETNSLGE